MSMGFIYLGSHLYLWLAIDFIYNATAYNFVSVIHYHSLAFCDRSLRFIKLHMKDAVRCLPCSGWLLFMTVTDLGSHSLRLT